MTATPAAALIYGDMPHHVDHLVPLCELLNIPLIVTEESIFENARHYYPFITTQYFGYADNAEKLIKAFDVFFCCTPRLMFDEIFFFAQHLLQKRAHTIWCPHGNSDKGHHSYFMKALKDEEVALVYGKKMIDFLIEKQVFYHLKGTIQIGNLRYTHYLKHKAHYASLLEREITRKFPPSPRTLLYAPTWQDVEKNSTFFAAAPHLIETLPDHWNLIIKLHPNLTIKEEIKLNLLIEKHQDKANLLFVKQFYPIYPLLDCVDLYLGDMSSIGYDFLTFNKPLFFLNPHNRDPKSDPALYLMRCGTVIPPASYPSIYTTIEKALPHDTKNFAATRKEVYDYTFGKTKNTNKLKEEILNSFALFPDKNLPLG